MSWTPEEDATFRAAVDGGAKADHRHNGAAGAEPDATAPAQALAEARIDLTEIIRNGIPVRRFVPGCEPWLIATKRYLIPAPAGTGKSLGATVIAVEVVDSGGTVAILDVENGAEEYATRLESILGDRNELAQTCSERLRYYAWPAIRTDWRAEEWAAALADVDLVIFDSSRLMLSAAGLAEDSNDDYATFVNALLIPLARAGISTLVLDNTGHEERDRARGASTKGDLNEVVYVAKVGKPFDRDQTGELHLHRTRTRFADLPAQLTIVLGGGVYQAPAVTEDKDTGTFRPTGLMQKASKVIEDAPGLSREDVLTLVGGRRQYASPALTLLVTEGYVRAETDGREKHHYSITPYRQADDDAA